MLFFVTSPRNPEKLQIKNLSAVSQLPKLTIPSTAITPVGESQKPDFSALQFRLRACPGERDSAATIPNTVFKRGRGCVLYRYVSSTKGRRARLWPLASWSSLLGTCPKCRLYAYVLSTSWYVSGIFRRSSSRKFFEENNLVLRLPRLCRLDWHE